MAVTEFSAALNQVATERGIPVESVLETIKLALVTAYHRDYGDDESEISAELDPKTGEAKIFDEEGKDITPAGFGRIAAQTAKQVILQKIRETEKEVVMDEYKSKIGTVVRGTIFRMDNGLIVLDLGRAHGVLPQSEQVDTEEYKINQRLKVLIKDVRETSRGNEIIVSRSDPEFIIRLFEQEVPEIASDIVKIEAIAREAGSRTKMAVSSSDDKIDPVGSCVGQKGVRVQAIISELFGEKIDIVPYSQNIERFIASSLSPAKVTEVEVDPEKKEAQVSVLEDQLSLAIGKEGQNVRLAHKLTKWKIDIKGAPNIFAEGEEEESESDEAVQGVWDAEIKAAEEAKEVEAEEANTDESDAKVDETKDSSGAEAEAAAEESLEEEDESIESEKEEEKE